MPSRMRAVGLIGLALLAGAWVAPVRGAAEDAAGSETLDAGERRGKAYAHLMRALFAFKRNELRAAAHEVREAVALLPDSADVRIQGAVLLRWMGRWDKAEQLAREALAIEPDNLEALRFIADAAADRALSGREDPDSRAEAIQRYEDLQGRGADDAALLRRLARLKLQAGDRTGALDAARQLVESRPGDRNASLSLAQLLLEEGQAHEALGVVLRFILAHPDETLLIQHAGELARQLGAWDLVEQSFAQAGEAGRRPSAAQRLRGEALLNLRRIDEAVGALEGALDADPTDRNLELNLARAYRSVGRLADARERLERMTEASPGDADAQLLLAETLADQDDVEGALNAYIAALRLFSAVDETAAASYRDMVRRRMASLYLAEGEHRSARRLIGELENPAQPEALQLAVRLELDSGDWTAARQVLRELRSVGEEGTAALLEGELNLRSGRFTRAEAKFAEAVASLGPFTRVQAAELYLDSERPDVGERLLREWVALEPDNPGARYYLGSYLYRTDRFAAAEVQLREAFRLNPGHGPALNFLGYSMAERNDRLDEALELIQRALEVDGWNGAYLDSLGWVYFQMGRYEEALDPLLRAAREYPRDSTVLEHLGDLYERLGERQQALAAWSQALEAGPEDAEALLRKIARAEADGGGGEEEAADRRIQPSPSPMPR